MISLLRIILKEEVTHDDVSLLAWKDNWTFLSLITNDEYVPYVKMWHAEEGDAVIYYIEDSLLSIQYIKIEGREVQAVAAKIYDSLDAYTGEEIFHMIDEANDSNDYIRAIYCLGAFAGESFDSKISKYFDTVFSNSDPEVRRAAIFATAYCAWREFDAPLQRLRISDPDQNVRTYADLMLESHAKYEWDQIR